MRPLVCHPATAAGLDAGSDSRTVASRAHGPRGESRDDLCVGVSRGPSLDSRLTARPSPAAPPRLFPSAQNPHISDRVAITKRRAVVAARRRVGDWEADTMVTREGAAVLQVVVERRTRYTFLNRLPARTAHAMRCTLSRALGQISRALRRTLTYDNGSENADYGHINAVLGTCSYFCTRYTSQERGTSRTPRASLDASFPSTRTSLHSVMLR